MSRIRQLCVLAVLAAPREFLVQADSPAQFPEAVARGQSAQDGATVAGGRTSDLDATWARPVGTVRRAAQTPTTRKQAIPPAKPWPTAGRGPASQQSAVPGTYPKATARTRASTTRGDARVLRVQTSSSDMNAVLAPAASRLQPTEPPLTSLAIPPAGGQSISLQAALYGALTSNPDLVTLRQGNALAASAEAVEVARHFPTALNPTLWIDYRPITLIPNGTFGTTGPSGHAAHTNSGFYHYGQNYIYISLRQPVELGHQTTHRYHIAEAAFDQQKWVVVQAELTALVQTYRFYQMAAYRREKYRLSRELADFNDRLSDSLQKRMDANQVQAADVALARVESRATRQLVKAARQDYLTALTDLRNQIGIPEHAGALEPLGEFTLPPYIPPVDEQVMIQEALQSRPDIHAANAQVAGTYSAVKLAKGDRIPTPVIGPQYAMDEAGIQYIGFVLISPLPIWNSGKPLVLQREAEHRRAIVAYEQAQQRATAQVRAGVAKWNGATELVNDSTGLSKELDKEVNVLERLFEAGQADLTKLMQARQRLIQLENAQLDAVWQATQAQADLLLALGAPSLIHGMLSRAESDDVRSTPVAPAPAAGSPNQGARAN
jgi:cobalt-zinc-cadmium efflux system outer membrane protein